MSAVLRNIKFIDWKEMIPWYDYKLRGRPDVFYCTDNNIIDKYNTWSEHPLPGVRRIGDRYELDPKIWNIR